MKNVNATAAHVGAIFADIWAGSAHEIEASGMSVQEAKRMLQARIRDGAETWAIVDDTGRCAMVGFPSLAGPGFSISTVASARFENDVRAITRALSRKLHEMQKRWPDARILCVSRTNSPVVLNWYKSLGFELAEFGEGYSVYMRPSLIDREAL